MKLGRLEVVDIRGVWRNEAGDFTPWLAQPENLSALGEALHLGELTLVSTERGVGDFSADIVATDEDGASVLIENQLEQTDHRHLGQVLTYLAGLGDTAATVIWMTTRFREEHRAAIDWLNRNTVENFDFFGVEIEVLRIGNSDPAPRFNVVAMPNDWAKQARQAVNRSAGLGTTETGNFYREYWSALKELYAQSGQSARFPKAWPRPYLPFSIGRSGFTLRPSVNRNGKSLRMSLYMHQKGMPPKQAFNALISQKTAIESDYDGALDWQELPAAVASRIAVHLPEADADNRADWPRQHSWILQELAKFRQVFARRVKDLRLDELPSAEPGEGEADEGE
jgi:hypothetical protein